MGILLQHADLIIREHKYRPLPNAVHLLGRQTVHFDLDTALRLLAKHDVKPADVAVEFDHATRGAKAADAGFISDQTFFGLLGVENVRAIDCSDYEGAEIIADLNRPIPAHLEHSADFIFGGSVLDNIFNPATYIKNINRLLRPGGRLVDQNIISFYHHAYLLASPAWYFDYFVLNGFADCKVYISEHPHNYALVVTPEDEIIGDFGAAQGMPTGITLIAEKGADSTWEYEPNQDGYRSVEEWVLYRKKLSVLLTAKRPVFTFSLPSLRQISAMPPRNAKSLRYLGVHSFFDTDDFDEETFLKALAQGGPSKGIHILEATYGGNQIATPIAKPSLLPASIGNVTALARHWFEGLEDCTVTLDLLAIGDPAPERGKDFEMLYVFRQDPDQRLRRLTVPGEAHGKTIHIPKYEG